MSSSVLFHFGESAGIYGRQNAERGPLILIEGRKIMSSQGALPSGNQFVSDNGLEPDQTLQGEATGNRIDEFGTVESTSPVQISHHASCCCLSCWQKNMNSFL